MKQWQSTLTVGAMMSVSFLVGQWIQPMRWSQAGDSANGADPVFGGEVLQAQGRGPSNPPPAPPVINRPATAAPVVYPEDSGQASSANGFLAVTGSYGVGTSVLYVVDTVNRQLAVYEARGGSESQRQIVLVGARKLDLDLMLEGYNDRSEYDYRKLRKAFEGRGSRDPDISTGLESSGGSTAPTTGGDK
jgi:hypothetical protein